MRENPTQRITTIYIPKRKENHAVKLDKKSIMITLQFIICCIIGIEVSLSPNPYTTHLIIALTIYICLKYDIPNKIETTIKKFVKGLKL